MKIFITGTSSGLGKLLASGFYARGHSVWGAGRRQMDETGDKFHYSVCDISKPEDIDKVYQELENSAFIPDIVILNAAAMDDDLGPLFSYSIFQEVFNINLFGAISWVNKFLPLFLARRSGKFVAISSLAARRALGVNKIAYPSSKAALSMAFESFRLQINCPELRFITFHIGPLSEKTSLLKTSYQKASGKIIDHLCRDKKADVVDFPFIPTLITEISTFFPDRCIAKILSRIK